jgi:choline transport protein
MVLSHLLSGGLGLVFVVIYLFCMVDVRAATHDDTGYPFLFVFRNAFDPAIVNSLTAIVLVLVFAGTVSYNLSSSRQILAVSSAYRKRRSTLLTIYSSLAMEAFRFPHG